MSVLNQDLAQQIVNRTMNIIDRNINVMNEQGIIIGSGDAKRVNTTHDGAVSVITTQSTVEITQEESKRLKGSKPGVNLPILFKSEIVGVVGITGEPEQVRGYGELIKMTAEMILEQSFLMEQLQWNEKVKEELIFQLVQGDFTLDPWYVERAKALGITFAIPRVAVFMEVPPSDLTESEVGKKRKKIISLLKGMLDDGDLMSTAYSNHIIVLKRCMFKDKEWNWTQSLQKITSWHAHIAQLTNVKLKIAMGSYYPTIEGISKSFQEAKKALETGNILFPEENILQYQALGFPVLLYELKDDQSNFPLIELINKIVQSDKKGELLQTLKTFIEENGEIKLTAEKLYIHRNTLHYRLDKIRDITNRDPKKIKELMDLYTAMLLYQLQTR